MNFIGITSFAKRQTKDNNSSHFEGDWDELIQLTTTYWSNRKISPHNSEVHLVPIPEDLCSRFYTSVVPITPDTKLSAYFAPRVEGEAAFIQVNAQGTKKSVAKKVEIIVYSHQVLAQDNDAPVPQTAEHYIVNVNAYPTTQAQPMNPMTMARNLLNLTGGTKPEVPYSPEEFAKAIVYWSQHCQIDVN